jgi:hypothetical protein
VIKRHERFSTSFRRRGKQVKNNVTVQFEIRNVFLGLMKSQLLLHAIIIAKYGFENKE